MPAELEAGNLAWPVAERVAGGGELLLLDPGLRSGFWQPEGDASRGYGYTGKDEERGVKASG